MILNLKKSVIIISCGFILLGILFYSKDEVAFRFKSHDNLFHIKEVYEKYKEGVFINDYNNDLLHFKKNDKGIQGKSLIFYYKSKTNCLNLFQEITPKHFQTKEREYFYEQNPKPARVCHTNYSFGDLNYIEIYK